MSAPEPEPVFDDVRRAEARAHIRTHARGEVERIEKLSRVREFVLGAQDGLLVPLHLGAAIIPLWPYLALPLMAPATITSLLCTLRLSGR